MRAKTLDDISFTIASERGATAAVKGEGYDTNPYDRVSQPTLHRYWSEGHNGMRARMALDKQNGILT